MASSAPPPGLSALPRWLSAPPPGPISPSLGLISPQVGYQPPTTRGLSPPTPSNPPSGAITLRDDRSQGERGEQDGRQGNSHGLSKPVGVVAEQETAEKVGGRAKWDAADESEGHQRPQL